MNYTVIYYLIVLVSAIFARLAQIHATDKKNTYKLNKIFYTISFLFMFLFLGLRSCGVGVDDYNYRDVFFQVKETGLIDTFLNLTIEPGYLLLNYVVGLFTDNFQVIMLIFAFASLFFVYKAMEYERKNINFLLAFFVFGMIIYPYFFGILRLSLTISISLYALKYFFEQDRKKYNILIFIASMFHYSAFILFLLNLLMKKDINSKVIKNFYLAMIVVLPLLFVCVSTFIVPLLGERYDSYTINGFSVSLGDFDKLPIVIACVIFYKNMKKVTNNSSVYIMLYSVSIILSVYSSLVDFGRAQWYFNIIICFIFPILVRGISNNEKYCKYNYALIFLIVVYCILYSNRLTNPDANIVNFDNYENIFLKE